MKYLLAILFLLMQLSACTPLAAQPSSCEYSPQTQKLAEYLQCSNCTYTTVTASYRRLNPNENIDISYPQLDDLNNLQKQIKINNIIEEEAIAILDQFNHYTENSDNHATIGDAPNFTIEINYDIPFSNNKLISVVFSGYSNVLGSAHPLNQFYTLNLDLEDGNKIVLSDITSIDLKFIKNIRNATVSAQEPALSLYTVTDDALLERLNDLERWGISWYLTKDSLCISFPVPHAAGDHAEIFLRYHELGYN